MTPGAFLLRVRSFFLHGALLQKHEAHGAEKRQALSNVKAASKKSFTLIENNYKSHHHRIAN